MSAMSAMSAMVAHSTVLTPPSPKMATFSTAADRDRYWNSYFPWRLAWELIQGEARGVPPRPAHHWVSRSRACGWDMTRNVIYSTLERWRDTLVRPEAHLLSLHVTRPAHRFLVFDYDVSDTVPG